MLALVPTGIVLIEGGIDGLIQQNDLNNGRTAFHQQWSTYYEGGLFVLGGLLSLFNVHPDISEPMLFGGGFGISSKFGRWALQAAQGSSSSSSGGGPGNNLLQLPQVPAGSPYPFGTQRYMTPGAI
jgi:hypothetical protein